MERVVANRLNWELDGGRTGTPLLHFNNAGFTRHRSTEEQVVFLLQEIFHSWNTPGKGYRSSGSKMRTVAVFVDFQRAFDKVWKYGLYAKML